ncbi:hypothetical protein BC833DRAFT_642074 [Globomyces pollinis-pini]|nr:hypothetical protein BC833DRAFT_642074 [Globomyces pollinis-pini]
MLQQTEIQKLIKCLPVYGPQSIQLIALVYDPTLTVEKFIKTMSKLIVSHLFHFMGMYRIRFIEWIERSVDSPGSEVQRKCCEYCFSEYLNSIQHWNISSDEQLNTFQAVANWFKLDSKFPKKISKYLSTLIKECGRLENCKSYGWCPVQSLQYDEVYPFHPIQISRFLFIRKELRYIEPFDLLTRSKVANSVFLQYQSMGTDIVIDHIDPNLEVSKHELGPYYKNETCRISYHHGLAVETQGQFYKESLKIRIITNLFHDFLHDYFIKRVSALSEPKYEIWRTFEDDFVSYSKCMKL